VSKIKIAKDKLAIIMGAGLLGYYLAISIFRDIIRYGLDIALPPINNRHLPQYYVGFEGAAIALIIAYLVYTAMVEKKSMKQFKRKYITALGLLIVLPILIAGAFRLDAVSYVIRAESTTPTKIHIQTHENILFMAEDGNSGTGFPKTVMVDERNLKAAGEMIRKMRLLDVVDEKSANKNSSSDMKEYAIFIQYTINGKWYSKILTYKDGIFEERVGIEGNRMARYESRELEDFIKKEISNASDINYYNKAMVADYKTIEKPEEQIVLEGANFEKLRNAINANNEIKPGSPGTERIAEALKNGIRKEEKDIYAIRLMLITSDTSNFMVYDDIPKVLYFEGKYYRVPGDFLL
jgi:hypothetical protein